MPTTCSYCAARRLAVDAEIMDVDAAQATAAHIEDLKFKGREAFGSGQLDDAYAAIAIP